MTPRIVVIGSSNTDMVVKVPHLPGPGETVLGGGFAMVPGGKGANQAVAAAKLGAHVHLVARLGLDMFGDRALEQLRAQSIHTDFTFRDWTQPSGVALIFVDERGENTIAVASGANLAVSPADVDAALPAIEQAQVVVLQLEVPLETVAYAVRVAKERDKTVLLNPAPAQTIPDEVLAGIDILTPNQHELKQLTGKDQNYVENARLLLNRGVRTVIVTLGEQGAVIVHGVDFEHIPAFKVRAEDTTAAGDAFTGALAVATAEGQPLREAVRFASAAAAISVTRLGAQPSMADRAEVGEMVKG